jgi:hypothetical protein
MVNQSKKRELDFTLLNVFLTKGMITFRREDKQLLSLFVRVKLLFQIFIDILNGVYGCLAL